MRIVDLSVGLGSYSLATNINIPTIPVKEYKSDLKSGYEECSRECQWIFIDVMNVKYPDLKSDLYSLIAVVDLSVGLGSYSFTQNMETSLTAKGELNSGIQIHSTCIPHRRTTLQL